METSPMMCRCGHPRATHEHYRRGDDCGACGSAVCAGFAKAAGDNVVHFRQQIVSRLRVRPARTAPLVPAVHRTSGAVAEAKTHSAV